MFNCFKNIISVWNDKLDQFNKDYLNQFIRKMENIGEYVFFPV